MKGPKTSLGPTPTELDQKGCTELKLEEHNCKYDEILVCQVCPGTEASPREVVKTHSYVLAHWTLLAHCSTCSA